MLKSSPQFLRRKRQKLMDKRPTELLFWCKSLNFKMFKSEKHQDWCILHFFFLLLPQKVTFIQSQRKKKKKKNDKMSIPWLRSLPPPAAPQPPPRFYPWLVLGSTTAPLR